LPQTEVVLHDESIEISNLNLEHLQAILLFNTLWYYFESEGMYELVEARVRELLQLCENVLGKGHPETLNSISYLTLVLGRQGKYEEAERMH